MKKNVFILLLSLCMILFISACSKSNIITDGINKEELNNDSQLSSNTTGRKIVITAEMRLETKTFKEIITTLNSEVAKVGGYVESSNIQNNDDKSSNANFVFRIPANKLSEFLSFAEGSGKVISGNQSGNNVTIEYSDTQSEVKILEVKEERLLALLEKASNLADILNLEEELNKVRTSIEKLNTRINELNNLIDYATVKIYIFEVKDFTVKKPGFIKTISNAAISSGKAAYAILKYLVVFIIYIAPYTIVAGVIIFIYFYIRKRKINKK